MTNGLLCYTYEKQVGKGAFGRVYKVVNENGECHALKEIGMTDVENLKSAMKEWRFSNLENPYILKYKYVDMRERPPELERIVLDDGTYSRPNSVLEIAADEAELKMRCYESEYQKELSSIDNDEFNGKQTNAADSSNSLCRNLKSDHTRTINNCTQRVTLTSNSLGVISKPEVRRKKYCYYTTEYCPFSMRELIDCRNDFIFNNLDGYKELSCTQHFLTDNHDTKFDIENLSFYNDSIETTCKTKKIRNELREKKPYTCAVEKRSAKKHRNFQTSDELGIKRKIPRCLIKGSLNPDLSVNRGFVYALIKQILLGLIYLHSKNIVHNDIKPSNIFFSTNFKPKIGDFGMMNIFRNNNTSLSSKSFQWWSENTLSYKDAYKDIKQVGLILFELFYPMKTTMERYQRLPDLEKNGVLPEKFADENPDLSELILACVSFQTNRPVSAMDIYLRIQNAK